jgi:hypothetical protein
VGTSKETIDTQRDRQDKSDILKTLTALITYWTKQKNRGKFPGDACYKSMIANMVFHVSRRRARLFGDSLRGACRIRGKHFQQGNLHLVNPK